MLILTRRVGETLIIGETVEVTVLGVKGNQVRIGVAAPRSVAVHRKEIADKIAQEARDSVAGIPVLEVEGMPAGQAMILEGGTEMARAMRAALEL